MAGRPRKLNEIGVTLSAHVPLSLKLKVEEIANTKGVSSSDIVRQALESYLQQAGSTPPTMEQKNDPPITDPLMVMDLDVIREALSAAEKHVEELELAVKPLLTGHTLQSRSHILSSYKSQILSRTRSLKSELYRIKRQYQKIRHHNPELTDKLLKLYNTVCSIEKAFAEA
ncbi:MAG: ribbon-helix-helix protein, CopG family [Thermofilaceae archaeon]